MLSATAGTWLRYAAVLLFQALYAWSFGSTAEASLFVLALSLAIALSWILDSTVRTIAVPRLAVANGVPRSLIPMFWWINVAAVVTVVAFLACAGPLGAIAEDLHAGDGGRNATLARLLSIWMLFHFWAAQLAALQLAHGRRFWPSVTPSLPFLVAALWLVAAGDSSVTQVATALCAGAVLEFVFLVGLTRSAAARPAVVEADRQDLNAIALLTVGQLVLLAMMGPIERFLAEVVATGGAFHYDYATRSLMALYQLVLGGLTLVALVDWAILLRDRSRQAIRVLMSRIAVALVALSFCFTLAAALAPALVRAVYERGSFTSADTAVVAEIMIISAPGMVALSASILLTQVLLADQRNVAAVRIGAVRFASHIVLAGTLSPWGVNGIALGVSLAELLTLAFSVWLIRPVFRLEHAEQVMVAKLVSFLCVALFVAGAALVLDVPGLLLAAVTVVLYGCLLATTGAYRWIRQAFVDTKEFGLGAPHPQGASR